MKNTLFFSLFILMLMAFTQAYAQNCTVDISGGNCTGIKLSAITNGGELSRLTWYQYTNNVFESDTISSQISMTIVAGNNGSGSSSNQFRFPAGGISLDTAGNVYVADIQNNRIQKWAPGATTGITVAGGHGAGSAADQLYYPADVFVDVSGNIYVADEWNNRIQKWLPGATTGITVAGGNGPGNAATQLNGPKAVYADNDGNILVADTYNYRVQLWKKGASQGITVAGGNGAGNAPNQFSHPLDIYADAAKNIYVADANTGNSDYHRVQKWRLGGTTGVTVAGGNGTGTQANQFGFLLAIYVDAAGNLYTTDNGVSGAPVSRVQKWAPGAGYGVTVAGGHTNGRDVLSYPTGVAVNKQGLIYVLDGTYNPRVQKYIPTNGKVDINFTPTQPGPYSVKAEFKNGCTATSNTLIIKAKPETPVIYPVKAKGNSNLCDGGVHTFFVNEWDEATKYKWRIPITCSVVTNLNDTIVISVPKGFKTGNLKTAGTNSCGTSEQAVLKLLGRPVMPGKIKGPLQVQANQKGIVYSVADASSSHDWKVPPDAVIVAGQGSASIVVDWGLSAGIIAVNAYNDCGASMYREMQVSLINSFAVNNAVAANKFVNRRASVFPNPAANNATVKFDAVKRSHYTIELQNLNGVVLLKKNITAQQGLNKIDLDVSKLPAALYLIHIKNQEERIILKLTKEL